MIAKIVILSFTYFVCCFYANIILRKEEIENNKILILFGISLPVFLWTNIPIITMMCFPFLIGQCCIDFKKLELSDINNGILLLLSIIYGSQNEFYFVSLAVIGIVFFLLYLMPFSNMGFGDIKLLISTALFVPSKLIPTYIFYMLVISLIIGIFYKIKKKQNIFPMGPAIAIMCFVIQII